MIEPPLFKPGTSNANKPVISTSLAKTIKASVTLNARGKSSTLQLHLYGQYRYSMMEMADVWWMLDLATSFPSFEAVTGIDMHIHANPRVGASRPGGMLHDALSDDGQGEGDVEPARASGTEEDLSDLGLEKLSILPTPPVDGWLRTINLKIDHSIKFELDDYVVLSTHVMIFLRPHATMRLEMNDDTIQNPTLNMPSVQKDVMLGMGASVSPTQSSQFQTQSDTLP